MTDGEEMGVNLFQYKAQLDEGPQERESIEARFGDIQKRVEGFVQVLEERGFWKKEKGDALRAKVKGLVEDGLRVHQDTTRSLVLSELGNMCLNLQAAILYHRGKERLKDAFIKPKDPRAAIVGSMQSQEAMYRLGSKLLEQSDREFEVSTKGMERLAKQMRDFGEKMSGLTVSGSEMEIREQIIAFGTTLALYISLSKESGILAPLLTAGAFASLFIPFAKNAVDRAKLETLIQESFSNAQKLEGFVQIVREEREAEQKGLLGPTSTV